MRRRVMEFDPISFSRLNYWSGDGKFRLHREQNLTEVLRQNYEDRKHKPRELPGMDMQCVARGIPDHLLAQMYKNGILRDKQTFLRWLDRPENEPFRTTSGKLYHARKGVYPKATPPQDLGLDMKFFLE